MLWTEELIKTIKRNEIVCRAMVVRSDGSTPRDIGANMMIFKNDIQGTIGGGNLEFEVIRNAREKMNSNLNFLREKKKFPLGPNLGQCCGGYVEVILEYYNKETIPLLKALARKNNQFILHPKNEDVFPISSDTNEENYFTSKHFKSFHPVFIYGAGHAP